MCPFSVISTNVKSLVGNLKHVDLIWLAVTAKTRNTSTRYVFQIFTRAPLNQSPMPQIQWHSKRSGRRLKELRLDLVWFDRKKRKKIPETLTVTGPWRCGRRWRRRWRQRPRGGPRPRRHRGGRARRRRYAAARCAPTKRPGCAARKRRAAPARCTGRRRRRKSRWCRRAAGRRTWPEPPASAAAAPAAGRRGGARRSRTRSRRGRRTAASGCCAAWSSPPGTTCSAWTRGTAPGSTRAAPVRCALHLPQKVDQKSSLVRQLRGATPTIHTTKASDHSSPLAKLVFQVSSNRFIFLYLFDFLLKKS